MSDKPTFLPGTLALFSATNEKVMSITLDIPAQTITLTGYRIEMGSAANALTEKVLYLDIPRIFNVDKVIDSNIGHTYIPLFLDNAAVTLQQSLDIPISMAHHLPSQFSMRILNGSFLPVSNLVHISLFFKVDYGHSN